MSKTYDSITIKIGKLDKEKSYLLELLWVENGMEQSLKEVIPEDLRVDGHTGDYNTYREKFVTDYREKAEFSDIGRHLYSLLRTGGLAKKWDELKAYPNGEGLRVLLDIEEPDLRLLPWELIFDGVQRPFQDIDNTIVRVRDYDATAANLKAEPVAWPLRILIMIGVNDDKNVIGAAEEVEKIEDALRSVNHLVDIEVLEQPDINDLEKECAIFKPHVFHYIGHGGVSNNDDAYILLKGRAGNDTWTANQIKTSLSVWGVVPRFAFINACRTADKAVTIQNQKNAWSIGDAFSSLGAPAVLTMQADIKGSLAGMFAGMLYERLATGEPIEKAAVAARIKLRDNSMAMNKDDLRDWATPMLTISIPPDQVLPFNSNTDIERLKDIKDCELFREVSILANRRCDRRRFIHGFYPIPPKTPDKELIFVRGTRQSGKTWMTLWCLEACARQNHDVRYVEVASVTGPKWLDVLLQIQKGDPSKIRLNKRQLIFKPLNLKAFNEFNHDLPYRLRNETPPKWDGRDVPLNEDELKTEKLDTLSVSTVKDIFKSFRIALVQAAEVNNPLIIVLDRFRDEESSLTKAHMNEFLVPFLFEPAAAGDLKSPDGTQVVKFVVVLSDEDIEYYTKDNKRLNDLRHYYHEVPLGVIPQKDFEKVAKEFFRNLLAGSDAQNITNKPTQEDVQFVITKYARKINTDWQPNVLKDMRDIVEVLAKYS